MIVLGRFARTFSLGDVVIDDLTSPPVVSLASNAPTPESDQAYNGEFCEFDSPYQRESPLRFGIRDLLVATFVVALCLLVVRSYRQVEQKRLQIATLHERLSIAETELQREKATRSNIDARFDLAREVASIHDHAMRAFETIKSKHGVIEPVPGRVSYRQLPALKDSMRQTRWAYRIHVPPDFPVFLRTGMVLRNSIPSAGRANLDEQAWLDEGPLQDSVGHEIELSHGEHDVMLTVDRGDPKDAPLSIELRIDDLVLFDSSATKTEFRKGSSMSSTPKTQYNIRFDKPSTKRGRYSQFLVKFEIREPDPSEPGPEPPGEFDYWLWLSATPMTGKFSEFSPSGDTNE